MYKIVYTNRMKKDVKLMQKRGKDMGKLVNVLSLLAAGTPLPVQYKDHPLTGNLQGFRECHIEPDWLLMYQIHEDIYYGRNIYYGTPFDTAQNRLYCSWIGRCRRQNFWNKIVKI